MFAKDTKMPIQLFTDYWVALEEFVLDKAVTKGDSVKLKNPLGESFWVIVTDIHRTNDIVSFTGVINNHLIRNSEYNYDDLVSFEPKDIREHKDSETRLQQSQLLSAILVDLTEILGYVPSIEEVETLFTRFSYSEGAGAEGEGEGAAEQIA